MPLQGVLPSQTHYPENGVQTKKSLLSHPMPRGNFSSALSCSQFHTALEKNHAQWRRQKISQENHALLKVQDT